MSKKDKYNSLFTEFSPTSKDAWVEKAIADLKGADFEKRLVWKNLSDVEVQPFYTIDERKDTLSKSGENAEQAINYRRIEREAENKNQLAQQAISEGMSGILFEVGPGDRVDVLLQGIDLEKFALSFSLPEPNSAFCSDLEKYFKENSARTDRVRGYLEIPVLSEYLTQGTLKETSLDGLAEVSRTFSEYPSFKTLVISGSEYLDSGASQSQEIAFTLNSIVFLAEEMKKRGLEEELIFQNLHLILGIGSEYFVEIAKFRAFSSLLHLVAGKYGVKSADPVLMTRSSKWTKSVLDANTNMLRATTETMSALLGNAQAIEIDAYDLEAGSSRDFSRRIAGNIATILKEESYFGKVRNPVDGSYYIEELTQKLAERALELFKEIESAGGFVKGIEQQVIQNKISLVRTTRIKLMSRRRKALVGVNKYPNLMEKISKEILCQEIAESDPKVLRPRRAGLELEVVRASTEALVEERGYRPLVEFAGFGNLAMRKARAGFAFDFLGVGGYEMQEERSYASAREAAETSAKSASDIVVICSSDDDYRESAMGFVSVFRSLAPDKVLLLAGAPEEMTEKLTSAGVDAFIHIRSDIIDTLTFIHKKISRTSKTMKI